MKKLILILIAFIAMFLFSSFNLDHKDYVVLVYQDDNISIYHDSNVETKNMDSLVGQRFLNQYINWELNLR